MCSVLCPSCLCFRSHPFSPWSDCVAFYWHHLALGPCFSHSYKLVCDCGPSLLLASVAVAVTILTLRSLKQASKHSRQHYRHPQTTPFPPFFLFLFFPLPPPLFCFVTALHYKPSFLHSPLCSHRGRERSREVERGREVERESVYVSECVWR